VSLDQQSASYRTLTERHQQLQQPRLLARITAVVVVVEGDSTRQQGRVRLARYET